jgi:hypothetical protein
MQTIIVTIVDPRGSTLTHETTHTLETLLTVYSPPGAQWDHVKAVRARFPNVMDRAIHGVDGIT